MSKYAPTLFLEPDRVLEVNKHLTRIYSYVASSLDQVLGGVIDPKDLPVLELGGYPDADLGGARNSTRSVSGNITGLQGPNTWITLEWSSGRQTSEATSTSESELVSMGKLVKTLIPLQHLWTCMLGRPLVARVYEDNQAAIAVAKSGFLLL